MSLIVTLFIKALIVGLVGFGRIAGGQARVAKMVFFIARAPGAGLQ